MKTLLTVIILMIMAVPTAQAQDLTKVGITGTIVNFNAPSSSPLLNGPPRPKSWSLGAVYGEPDGHAMRIAFERFGEMDRQFADNSYMFRDLTTWATYSSIRGEMEWALPAPDRLFVTPTVGIIGGAAFIESYGGVGIGGLCEESPEIWCRGRETTSLNFAPKDPRGSGPYVGVTIGAKKMLPMNTVVGATYDVYSTYDRKLRVNFSWRPWR